MSDRTIDQADRDTTVTGVELVPVSDGGAAKAVSVGQIKDFVEASIASASQASSVDSSSDKVYLCKGGNIRLVDAGVLAASVLDYGFAKAGVVSINGNETVGVKDSTSAKTVTLGAVKTWLEGNMTVDAELDFGSISAASTPLDGGSYIVIGVGDANKKVTIAEYSSWVSNRFASFVNDLSAVQNMSDDDKVYIVQGETAKKCSVSQLKSKLGLGDVTGPVSTTENKVPQWDSVTKKLKDGLSVCDSIQSDTPTTDLATVGAVSAAMSALDQKYASIGGTTVTGPATTGESSSQATTENNIPQWDSTVRVLKDGLGVSSSIGSSASDLKVPTEKAVSDAIAASKSGIISSLDSFISEKQFVSGSVVLDDKSVNVISITGNGTYSVGMPAATGDRARNLCLALSISASGTVSVGLTGGSFRGAASDTFSVASGNTYLIRFVEISRGTFLVSKEISTSSGTAFSTAS